MSRRWFALTSGLVVSPLFVTIALGQASKPPASLADRMSALRRGWSQGQTSAGAAETSGEMGVERQGPSQPGARSLWPNIFGRGNERSAAPPNGNAAARRVQGQSNTARRSAPQSQRTGDTPLVPRTATRPRAGAVQSAQARANSATLPGLGGSPLPNARTTQASGSSRGGPDISQEVTDDYPVIQGTPSTSGSARSDTVRQSPHRRTAPHIDPDHLRRELTGTFPAPANGAVASPRTARATTTGRIEESQDMSEADFGDSLSKESTSITRLTLPTDDRKPPGNSDSADEVGEEIDPQSARINGNSSPKSTSRTTGTSPDLGSAFGGGTTFRSQRANSTTTEQPVVRETNSAGQNAQANPQEPGVLVSNQTPLITTNICGPKQILVGREATYQVQLHNAGDVAAEGIVANIRIPSWAEVVGTSSTQGMIQQGGDASASGQLRLAALARGSPWQ
jgi:hypothetical protein